MNAKLSESTVKRIEKNTDRPISRGMDKAVNDVLDQLDSLKEIQDEQEVTKNQVDCLCDSTKKVLKDG